MVTKNKNTDKSTPSNWSVEDKPVKIDKWDGAAVKNSLDDAVKKVFTERYKYTESHALMDGRLAICLVAVATAVAAVLWDYLYPFPQSRPVLMLCVTTYFLLMGVFTVYTSFVEKGIFMVAVDKDPSGVDRDKVWKATSSLKRFDDMYKLVISYTDSAGNTRESKIEKSVASWYDENGVLVMDTFEPDVSHLHDSILAGKKVN